MKNRILTLLLSTGFVLTAFAQQSNSSSSEQSTAAADQKSPSSQPQNDTGMEPLLPPSHQDFWEGDEPSLSALIMHPFASKEYVRRYVQPIRDRLNELDELTESNKKTIRDVDARAQQGIKLASDKASLADEHAADATNKAQMAQQTVTVLNTRLSTDETLVGNIDRYKSEAQTELHFRAGQTVLSKQAKVALDEIATQVKNHHGYIIEVQGFSSGRGSVAIANSRKTADSVVRYLVLNHEIPVYRIYVIGMGNASAVQRTSGTRIEISVLKNDLEPAANHQ